MKKLQTKPSSQFWSHQAIKWAQDLSHLSILPEQLSKKWFSKRHHQEEALLRICQGSSLKGKSTIHWLQEHSIETMESTLISKLEKAIHLGKTRKSVPATWPKSTEWISSMVKTILAWNNKERSRVSNKTSLQIPSKKILKIIWQMKLFSAISKIWTQRKKAAKRPLNPIWEHLEAPPWALTQIQYLLNLARS